MKISINIIEKYLKDKIIQKNIRDDAEMTLESYEIYDANNGSLKKTYLYLIKADEINNLPELSDSLNFICCGIPEDFDIQKYQYINLFILDDITPEKLLNTVILIFHKYNRLEEQLNALIHGNFSLQKIIDLATEMVEMPLNVLDLNHNVLAISSEMDAPDDPLWEGMKSGYGYSDYDIVLKGEPKMGDIINARGSSVEMMSNISGHFIKVSMLYNKGHAVAAFGMHKMSDFEKPFEKHTIQVYDYIVNKLNKNFKLFFEAKADRGLLYEEFLHDVFNQKFKDSTEIEGLLSKLGFKLGSKYQMGLISFKNSMVRTDYYFTMMDFLERTLPDSKCIVMDRFIYIIIPIETDIYLSGEMQKKLSEFLDLHQCFCVLSPVFISFDELYKINSMFNVVLTFIEKQNRDDIIYHFYEFANLYSMKLLSENMPADIIYHPMIQKLIDYDREHQSNYLETLKFYLRNECSISITSNLLHMHRNSLQYRINRIEKLIGVTFDDWKLKEQLLFYMTYMEYSDGFFPKISMK